MPDFGAPVAKAVDPNVGMQTLSNIIGLQRAQLGVQSSQLGLQQQEQNLAVGASNAQQATQQQAERQLLQQMTLSGKDPDGNPIKDQNGEINPTAFAAAANKFLPLTGQGVTQSIIQTMDNRLKLNDTVRQLGQNFRNDISGIVRSAVGTNQTPQDIGAALNTYAAQNPVAAPAINRAQALIQNLKPGIPQSQKDQALTHLAMELQPAATTENEQKPAINTYTTPGGQIGIMQTNPFSPIPLGKTGPNTPQGIPPGLNTFQDQAGNTWAFNPEAPGNAMLVGHGGGVGGGGGAGTPQATGGYPGGGYGQPAAGSQSVDTSQQPGTNGPPTLSLGEADVVRQNSQTVNDTRRIAADNQTQHDILNRIQSIAATPNLYLGPGSDSVAKLATTISQIPGMEGAAQYANNYNELAKFMAQNAARMGAAMGLSGSDARLDLALHSQPNAQMDPRTVQHVAQYMAGLVKMGAAKADAMDKWLQQPGNSLQNEQNFERLWRDNADPRIFQLSEMKDQNEAQNYANLHIRKSELADLQKKHDALKSLGAIQ